MRAGYGFVSWLARTYFRLMYGLAVHGLENLPLTGRIIIASNHRSNFDPPILGGVVPREVFFFAKEELFRKRLFARFIRYLNAFPVRRGQFDRESLAVCLNILKNDGALIFYPEGTRAPADGFLQAKLGLGWVACLSDAPVIPVYIHGSATAHRLRLRGRPGIHVVFGKPIPARELQAAGLRGKDLYQHVSDEALERIRACSVTTPGGIVPSAGPIYDRSIIDNERLR